MDRCKISCLLNIITCFIILLYSLYLYTLLFFCPEEKKIIIIMWKFVWSWFDDKLPRLHPKWSVATILHLVSFSSHFSSSEKKKMCLDLLCSGSIFWRIHFHRNWTYILGVLSPSTIFFFILVVLHYIELILLFTECKNLLLFSTYVVFCVK